jgi:hypothetical protein
MKELLLLENAPNLNEFLNSHHSTLKKVSPLPDHHKPVLNSSVSEIVRNRVLYGSKYGLDCDQEDAFYVADLGDVVRQHHQFKRLLPRVEPFFGNDSQYSFNKYLIIHSYQVQPGYHGYEDLECSGYRI